MELLILIGVILTIVSGILICETADVYPEPKSMNVLTVMFVLGLLLTAAGLVHWLAQWGFSR